MARRAVRATTASHRLRRPTKVDVALLVAGAGSIVNGLRLRRRATALHVLVDTDEAVHHDHVFITTSGVTLDEATKRAASAHLTAEGLEVLDLLPGDLPVERALDVLRGLDPATYRAERTAVVRTPAQAMVVDKDVVRRAGIAEVDGIDVAAFVRLASSTKLAAPRTTDVAVAPHLHATPESVEQRYRRFAAMPPLSLSGQVVSESLQALAIAAGLAGALRRRSPWAPVAAVGMSIQPHVALAGTPLRPSDLAGQPLTRAGRRLGTVRQGITAAWTRPDLNRAVDALRPEYAALMAEGTDRFLGPRRVDCPACGGTDLVIRVTSPDLMQHKPGRFQLDRCRACETVFQNPRPTGEGLDFYYRDFYDGLGADLLELLFGFGSDTHTARAALIDGLAQPTRWLDVGTGHGHFPMMAKEVWPDARFEGLDQSDGVDEALRRGWMDEAHHGQLTEVAGSLRDGFDVVSMFHYLEHTADPAAELDAATLALQPGGHLVIEMPDPQHPVARWLGRYWVPWMAPQHLNMVSVDRLGEMLEERGYTIVRRQTGEAHTGGDVTGGVLLALQHVAPPTFPVPWREPASLAAKARRAAGLVASVPAFAAAATVDGVVAPRIRRGPHSNVYRLVARLDEVPGREV